MKRFIGFVILVLGAAVFIEAQPHEYYCPIPIRNLSYASILESEDEFTFRTGKTIMQLMLIIEEDMQNCR